MGGRGKAGGKGGDEKTLCIVYNVICRDRYESNMGLSAFKLTALK